MKALLLAGVLTMTAVGLQACGDDAELPTVTGTVIVPPEALPIDELPAGAVLTVTLEDVSRADASSTVLATQTTELEGEAFPIPFELAYDLGGIEESNTYRVAARVTSGGDLLMISDTIVPVITGGAPTTGVTVGLVLIADN